MPPRPMHPILNKPLEHSTLEKIWILFGRALLLRCPACGQFGMFAGVYKLKETCPGCGLRLQRDESGYELGGMAINLVVAEGLWVIGFVSILYLTWPNPPWDALQWGSAIVMVALPLLLLRHSRMLALALDLLIRPPERKELVRPQTPRPGQ
ncbi:MAG: DUF983 domain-containing protein [Chloroflexi bacterium]|nr:DUF983 domain-containing protein [Chloroflexota bacterium]